jgi:hypothetical protein
MTHDPLCEWATPCIHAENQQHSRDTENLAVPDATYCWMCGADCLCDLIAKVREDERDGVAAVRLRTTFWERGFRDGQQDTLARCITAVEQVHSPIQHGEDTYCRGCADAAYDEFSFTWPCPVVTSVRALRENP